MIRSVWVRAVFAAGVLMTSPAFAQDASAAPQTKTIFDYKQELNLTDEQERKMKQILSDLSRDLQVERAKLTLVNYDLEELIKKEGNLSEIKEALQRQANLQVSMAYTDLVAGRHINAVLTPEQLTTWRHIQAAARQTTNDPSAVADATPHKKVGSLKPKK